DSQVSIDTWKALGANPTPMAWGEVYTALQQNTLDAQENAYTTIDVNDIAEVQDYLSNTRHQYAPMAFVFSKPIYDDMTLEQQKAIDEAAQEANKYNRELLRKSEEESLENLKSDMEFTELSDDKKEEMKENVQPVIDKYKEEWGEDFINKFIEAIEDTND